MVKQDEIKPAKKINNDYVAVDDLVVVRVAALDGALHKMLNGEKTFIARVARFEHDHMHFDVSKPYVSCIITIKYQDILEIKLYAEAK